MWLVIQYPLGMLIRLITRLFFPIKNTPTFPDLPKNKPVIIACNHHSARDPLIFVSVMPLKRPYMPIRFIIKHEYLSNLKPRLIFSPLGLLIRRALKSIGAVPAKKGGGKPLGKRLRRPIALLRRNHTIFIYVQGGKSDEEIIQTVKPGAPYMGLVTGAIVLPTVILGTYSGKRRSHYEIAVGDLIQLPQIDNPSHSDVKEAAETIRKGIAAVQLRYM